MFNSVRRYRVTMLASLLFLLSLAFCVPSHSEGTMIGEIVINATSGIDLLTGYTAQLHPLAVPDKSFDALGVMRDAAITNPQFVFSSSDPSVAVVDGTGTITGVGDGSATINISDTTGRLRSAQCLVTVQDRNPIYTAVLFAASNYEVPVNSIDPAFIESAKSFEEFLNKTQYAGRIFPVYDFTRADIEAWFVKMERWNDELHLTDYDATLIYIATHGMGDSQGNGLGFSTIEENEYITYQELKNGLDRVNGVVTVIADSCFSGGLIAEEHFELGNYLRRIFSAGSEWHNETFTTSGPMLEGKYKVLTATSYDETGLAWPNGLMYTSYIFLWDFSTPTAPTPSWQSLYGTDEYVTLNDVYQHTVSNTSSFVQWVRSHEDNENFTYEIKTQVWPENSNYPLFYFPQNETVTIQDDSTGGNAGAGNRLTGNVLVKHGEYSYYIIEDDSDAYVCRTKETSMQEDVFTPFLGSVRSNSLLINGNRMYLQEQYGDFNLFLVDIDTGMPTGQQYERITGAYDVYDGYIYFSDSVMDAETLSRIPITGGDKEILCRFEECGEIFFVIHDDRIYMNPSGTPSGIYTMNLNGSDLRQLWTGPYDIIRDMQLSDGFIYYYASNPKDLPGNYLYEMDISICRIPIEGESYPETLFTIVSDFFTMNVCGDKIYYTARTLGEDGGSEDSLYWFDMNSSESEFLWRPEGEFHFPGYSVYGSDVYVKIKGDMYRYNAESKTLYTFPEGTETSGAELYPPNVEEDKPEVFTDGDYQYRVEDDKAIITDYTGEETIIEIPETLGGYSVTAIDEYGFGWTDVKRVTLCDSMTELCHGAFNSCFSLEEVVLNEGLTHIGEDAFFACRSLSETIIPASVQVIGENAFGYTWINSASTESDYQELLDFTWETYETLSGLQRLKVFKTIYGISGSAAERYALNNRVNFVPVEEREGMHLSETNLPDGGDSFTWLLPPSISADDIQPTELLVDVLSTGIEGHEQQQMVIWRNGRAGMISYSGELLLPCEYDLVFDGGAMLDGVYYTYENGSLSVYEYLPADGEGGNCYWEAENDCLVDLSNIYYGPFYDFDYDELKIIREHYLLNDEYYWPIGGYGLASNAQGIVVEPTAAYAINHYSPYEEEYECFALYNGETWDYYNNAGEAIVSGCDGGWICAQEPFFAEPTQGKPWAFGFSEGYLAFGQGGKWGFCDYEGNIVVPLIFEATRPVHSGMAWVKYDGMWGVIQLSIPDAQLQTISTLTPITNTAVVDLDGDGIPESISMNQFSWAFTLDVNTAHLEREIFAFEQYDLFLADLDATDKTIELLLACSGNEGDYPSTVYWEVFRYNDEQLYQFKICSQAPDYIYSTETVKQYGPYLLSAEDLPIIHGDGTIVIPQVGVLWPYQFTWFYEYSYNMRIAMEGEKLVVYDESEFYPVHYNDMEDGHLILRTVWELPLYSQPDTESSIVTLPADAIITPISASPLGWLELRAESGETGYYLVNEEQALPGGGYLYDLLSDEFEWHD